MEWMYCLLHCPFVTVFSEKTLHLFQKVPLQYFELAVVVFTSLEGMEGYAELLSQHILAFMTAIISHPPLPWADIQPALDFHKSLSDRFICPEITPSLLCPSNLSLIKAKKTDSGKKKKILKHFPMTTNLS